MPWSGLTFLTIRALAILGVFLVLSSCSRTRETFDTPKPRAVGVDLSEVHLSAIAWTQRSPDRFYVTVLPTGSMEPFINENSIVLCVRYTGQPLARGAVVLYDHPKVSNVLHTLADQNDTHVILSGTANARTDGWHPKSSIKGYVVGQLYIP